MRLSEALIQRADVQSRIQQLRERLVRSARVQEDETPPEDPSELLETLQRSINEFSEIAAKINHTNQSTPFDENRTLTDVLAERDANILHRRILGDLIHAATGDNHRYRYNSTIKTFSAVNVREIQQQIDALSRQYRELDSRIQEINWTTELVE